MPASREERRKHHGYIRRQTELHALEYLERELAAEFRSEYDHGVIIPMPGASKNKMKSIDAEVASFESKHLGLPDLGIGERENWALYRYKGFKEDEGLYIPNKDDNRWIVNKAVRKEIEVSVPPRVPCCAAATQAAY